MELAESDAQSQSQSHSQLQTRAPPESPPTQSQVVKTVLLVRHAESVENEKLGHLKRWAGDVSSAKLPASGDLFAGLSLLAEPSIADSGLSEVGVKQVATLTRKLRETNLLQEKKVQVFVHSPLARAKETCDGVLAAAAAAAAADAAAAEKKSDEGGTMASQVREEWDVLREKTVSEWIPGFGSGLDDRIRAFEDRLAARDETCVLVVGHSQFFRRMLGMEKKFANCDVWQLSYVKEGECWTWRDRRKLLSVFEEVPGDLTSAPSLM
ncbi:Hypothetical Protein FCC1311_041622 [Hondaea fermentalgiana]|uniref:Uncharacterized protein n=1 Tax=Hondaea fermentalgiana TaxID=2315210 RepID=A0A2R5GC86_9STRA|nr:Hypothetical Protein FCC1311_041622 [Hondaea fermentalgiana]|eukprot:GBG27939.1 Hypothetical Protein FCC1311_041622 [Hondaea fermentalgiana]